MVNIDINTKLKGEYMNNTLKNYSKTFLSMLQNVLTADEGRKATPYRCTKDKLTFGVGHNIDDRGISPKVLDIQLKHMFDSSLHLEYYINVATKQVTAYFNMETTPFCDAAIDAQLMIDVNEALLDCERLYPNWSSLHPTIQIVLANMSFQLGYARLTGFKNMNAAVVVGDFKTMAIEMLDSKWAKSDTPKRAARLHKVVTDYLQSSKVVS